MTRGNTRFFGIPRRWLRQDPIELRVAKVAQRVAVPVRLVGVGDVRAVVAAIAVVIIAFLLGPLLTWLPMPVIAGVLARVGIGMIKLQEIRALVNRIDGPVFLITLLVALFRR